jgi:ribonuclease HI
MKTCKTCNSPLEIRKPRITAEKLLKHFYYSAYYYCRRCQKMYFDDSFKVMNKNYGLFTKPEKPVGVDVEIWTDGACVHNGTDRARAAWAFVSGTTEKAGRISGKQTNNVAEAYAIYHALLWSSEMGYKKIVIYSDSQISIGNLAKSYERVKENQEIFRLIQELVSASNLEVWYEKVLGHSGDPNNERVDKLANTLAASGDL